MTLKELEIKVNNLESAFLQMSQNNTPITEKADKVPTIQNTVNSNTQILDTLLGVAE